MLMLTLGLGGSAIAATASAEDQAFKFSAGYHRFSVNGNGVDVNLRHSSDIGNAWLGYFRSTGLDVRHARAGWDKSFGGDVRVIPSIQVASGGFAGGSLSLEAGKTWVIGAGLGRTNLRPYVNLNYDPNDSWQVYANHRMESGSVVYLSTTKENAKTRISSTSISAQRSLLLTKNALGLTCCSSKA